VAVVAEQTVLEQTLDILMLVVMEAQEAVLTAYVEATAVVVVAPLHGVLQVQFQQAQDR
jgi:uncharacterized protein YqgV (UPF0045/DUF77 family)